MLRGHKVSVFPRCCNLFNTPFCAGLSAPRRVVAHCCRRKVPKAKAPKDQRVRHLRRLAVSFICVSCSFTRTLRPFCSLVLHRQREGELRSGQCLPHNRDVVATLCAGAVLLLRPFALDPLHWSSARARVALTVYSLLTGPSHWTHGRWQCQR